MLVKRAVEHKIPLKLDEPVETCMCSECSPAPPHGKASTNSNISSEFSQCVLLPATLELVLERLELVH